MVWCSTNLHSAFLRSYQSQAKEQGWLLLKLVTLKTLAWWTDCCGMTYM